MKLERCSGRQQTLEEFYAQLTGDRQGELMLSLVNRLRQLTFPPTAWGRTMLSNLGLLAEDREDAPVFVRFVAVPGRYFVEYLLPDELAPWPEAYVTGFARTEDEAFPMIVKGIELSRGWQSSNS